MRTTVAYAMTHSDLTPGSARGYRTAEEHQLFIGPQRLTVRGVQQAHLRNHLCNRLRIAVSGEQRSDGNRSSNVVETSNHKIWRRT
jgi:hypothetical protein